MTIVTAAGVLLTVLASVYLLCVKRSSERRRARQQALLIGFSRVRSEQAGSPYAALKWLADALPAAWQHFGIACSRVTLDGRSFATPNFEKTPWRQQAEIVVEGKVRGQVEVCYREPKAPAGEDPFLPEEHEVLNEVARDIGLFVQRLGAENESRTASRILEKSPVVLYRIRIEPSMPLTYVSGNVSQYGYSAEEFLASPDFYRTLVHPDDQAKVRESLERVLAGAEVEAMEFRLRGRDGSWHWVSNYLTAARVESGHPRDAEGMLVDITPAKLAAEEVRKRERILDAIAKVAAELLEAPALDAALPAALSQVGEAVGADRVSLLERHRAQEGRTSLSCIWNAPEVEPRLPEFLESHPDLMAAPEAFYASLTTRQILTVVPRRIEGDFATFLRTLNIQSLLLVPILIEAERWGHLAFDDCHTERVWTTAECDALQVLAEIIGASVARERRTSELSDAQHIVDSSTTVLYRAAAEPGLPVTYVSTNVSRWGYRPKQFTAAPTFYQTLVHPDDQASVAEWIASLLRDSAAASSLELRFRLGDGSYCWFESRIRRIQDQAGHPAGFEGMLLDIDERKQAEQRLNFANAVLTTAMENAPEGFLVVDPDGRALAFNQRFVQMWKIPPQTAATRLEEAMLQAVVQTLQDPQGFLARIQYLNKHPDEKTHDELAFRDGRLFERDSAALYDIKHTYLGRIWFFGDITERKQAEQELARLARTDALTGLANRTTFVERLELMFAATRRGASPFAVLYVDLDNFKDVNDTLGHPAGDALLKVVAQRMAGSVRATDLAARLGGDEFAVLQADAEDPSTAGTLATKIRGSLAEPYQVDGSELRITATVGIALYSPDIENPAEILAQADRALYRAKEEGRDRYRFHSPELDALVHERITLSDELRKAIERDELELHYQPQVDVATGRIVGVEALVRWNHPQRGHLKPAAFLAAAEKTGAIVPLGDWVLDRACRQLRKWRDQGWAPPVMAVNLSGAQLRPGGEFNRKVAATLAKWRLAPEDLEFDVTESVLAASSSTQPDVLKQLRDMGIRIAIDDFGSDYTSIGRVKTYRVKRFKIAPQFINTMTSDPVNAGLVRMMISLARQLGIEIVAKSVETEEQRDFLRSVTDVGQAQGFYYSEPLDASRATELLRRKQMELPAAAEPAPARR